MNHRLFIAIDLPQTVRDSLGPLCCGLPGARWVRPEQMHLTLRFIGEADGGLFADIVEALTGVELAPFDLRLRGVGFFPPRGRPRVVWVGIAPSQELPSLQRKVNSCLRLVGVPADPRKFAPHITLARLQETPPSRVGRFMEEHGLYESAPFTVDRFLLYSSVLGRHGATHSIEHEYSLMQ